MQERDISHTYLIRLIVFGHRYNIRANISMVLVYDYVKENGLNEKSGKIVIISSKFDETLPKHFLVDFGHRRIIFETINGFGL